jgi:hypothetical protein
MYLFLILLFILFVNYYRARDIAPNSIRALYGISDTRNVTHGSGRYYWVCYLQYYTGTTMACISACLVSLIFSFDLFWLNFNMFVFRLWSICNERNKVFLPRFWYWKSGRMKIFLLKHIQRKKDLYPLSGPKIFLPVAKAHLLPRKTQDEVAMGTHFLVRFQ